MGYTYIHITSSIGPSAYFKTCISKLEDIKVPRVLDGVRERKTGQSTSRGGGGGEAYLRRWDFLNP